VNEQSVIDELIERRRPKLNAEKLRAESYKAESRKLKAIMTP
jgi:hypothetical protein